MIELRSPDVEFLRVPGHSNQMTEASIGDYAHDAATHTAEALASASIDVLASAWRGGPIEGQGI